MQALDPAGVMQAKAGMETLGHHSAASCLRSLQASWASDFDAVVAKIRINFTGPGKGRMLPYVAGVIQGRNCLKC